MTRPKMSQEEFTRKFHKPPTREDRNYVRRLLESRNMSNFQPLGNGVYRVGGMKRDAVTNRFITTGEEVSPEDTIPLVTSVRTVDTAWNLYIGQAIQVREKNNGEVQFRMGGDTEWTTAGFKEVN